MEFDSRRLSRFAQIITAASDASALAFDLSCRQGLAVSHGDELAEDTEGGAGRPVPACTSCGLCCYSTLESYVAVTGDDWSRLGESAELYAHFIGNRAYMNIENGHCGALLVSRTAQGEREYRCLIYAQRPQICRDLQRGSPHCESERLIKAARVGPR